MAEILFYHLESQPLERVLPVLLEKSLERGWNVVVEIASEERAALLDDMLWTYRDDSFLPHALAGGDTDHLQRILITTRPHNPNKAEVRFFVDRAVPQSGGLYPPGLHVLRPRPRRRHRSPHRVESPARRQRGHLLAAGQQRQMGQEGLKPARSQVRPRVELLVRCTKSAVYEVIV